MSSTAKFRMRWAIVRLVEHFGNHLRHSLRRWQAGRTAAALDGLSDELLSDVGIARADIPAVALRVTSPYQPATTRRASHSQSRKEVLI
jgi:uncharacterized protein YjiS (DUF1127 family)